MVHAGQLIVARKSTIEYLLWANATVVAPHPPFLENQPHLDVGGSIQGYQALRLSHMHPLYMDDKNKFYVILK